MQQRLKVPKRVINHAVKRKQDQLNKKDQKIKDLKAKLRGNALAQELEVTKAELYKLKRAHNELLESRKAKRKELAKTAPPSHALVKKLKDELSLKNNIITDLQNQNLELQEKNEELVTSSTPALPDKLDGKTYSTKSRMKVYDCIVNNVPTASIPTIIKQFNKREGRKDSENPSRSSVEMMARELGAVAELQTAEMVMANKYCTVGFDATMQEGTHINEVHFTTKSKCMSAAVEELAGGTANDYANHICETVDSMAETYCHFYDTNYQETRRALIDNITNSMSDRCAANHAALRLVNNEWNKTLNELNCHLHPLDSLASSTRTALKKEEETKGKVYGKDSIICS